MHSFGQLQRASGIASEPEAIAAVPVLVQDAAEAHVGHTCASDPREPPDRSAVPADAEEQMDPAATTLERCAVVRRPDADEPAERTPPSVARSVAVVACAACDEPTHAVANERKLVEGYGPLCDEALE